jgi:putative transcriptional regulator
MMADIRELLPLYALGVLEGDEAKQVEAAIAKDPALATELGSYREAAEGMIAPVLPSPAVKLRLMASIGHGKHETFATKMAALFDVAVDRARELLGLIERPASWEKQPVPGILLVHFDGGPACATADCGYVQLAPGATFPFHKHRGEEVSLIISGSLRDTSNGRVLGPGDEYVMPDGTSHELVCVGDEPCIFAARAAEGIEIGGAPVRFQR